MRRFVAALGLPTLLAAGCQSREVVTPTNSAGSPAVTPYTAVCPVYVPKEPWTHLAFPGCPSYAYTFPLAFADDRPCAVTTTARGFKLVVEHRYDEQGRWLAASSDGRVFKRCTYKGARLAACESIRLEGDGAGDVRKYVAAYEQDRLVKITTEQGHDVQTFHYARAGEVDRVIDESFGPIEIDYDAAHRVIRERSQGATMLYSYDDANRIAMRNDQPFVYAGDRVARIGSGDDAQLVAYDAQGRLASVMSAASPDDGTTYRYCR